MAGKFAGKNVRSGVNGLKVQFRIGEPSDFQQAPHIYVF